MSSRYYPSICLEVLRIVGVLVEIRRDHFWNTSVEYSCNDVPLDQVLMAVTIEVTVF
jgi:hypothetical protein